MFDVEDGVGVGIGLGEEEEEDGWFCSEAQALPVVVESLDVFAGHLTSKVMDSSVPVCGRGMKCLIAVTRLWWCVSC